MDANNLILLIASIVAGILLLLLIVFGLVGLWLRRKKEAITRRWEREGLVFLQGPVSINFSGFESEGMGQIRGNGFMALAGQELRISRAVPEAEWSIPYSHIKEVALADSFLGKRRGNMKVLVITFEQHGRTDRVGLYVADGPVWVEAIARAAGLDQ